MLRILIMFSKPVLDGSGINLEEKNDILKSQSVSVEIFFELN